MMKKEILLKMIAQKGYIICYAANLNFATYDIIRIIPRLISFISIVVGILGLVVESFRTTISSVLILIFGIIGLLVEKFGSNVDSYSDRGIKNTDLLNQLKNLYYRVKDSNEEEQDFSYIENEYRRIEIEFNSTSNPNQIIFFFCFIDGF